MRTCYNTLRQLNGAALFATSMAVSPMLPHKPFDALVGDSDDEDCGSTSGLSLPGGPVY